MIVKFEVMKYVCEGKFIFVGWVLDVDGNFIIDFNVGFKGFMVFFGGYKGVGVVFLIEIMVVVMIGVIFGIDVLLFFGIVGGLLKMGQFFMVIDLVVILGGVFVQCMEVLVQVVSI